jgi:hypothetical protein
MRIYIFKSESRRELRAFAGHISGDKLPKNHGPWTVTGVIGADKAPPHNLSREAIEEAIEGEGFQLAIAEERKEGKGRAFSIDGGRGSPATGRASAGALHSPRFERHSRTKGMSEPAAHWQ